MSTLSPNFNGPAKSLPRILVLDDDAELREIYIETLVQGGYQVDAAADGQAGWEALQAREYDLLITDNDMPKLSGLEVVKKLCSSGMKLAVIIASGSLSIEELKRQLPTQIAVALSKPFSPSELLKTVQHVLCGNNKVGAHVAA
jgi:DNA-binding response OmpR family regulator